MKLSFSEICFDFYKIKYFPFTILVNYLMFERICIFVKGFHVFEVLVERAEKQLQIRLISLLKSC